MFFKKGVLKSFEYIIKPIGEPGNLRVEKVDEV